MEAFNGYYRLGRLYSTAMASQTAALTCGERVVASACMMDGEFRIFTAQMYAVMTFHADAVIRLTICTPQRGRVHSSPREIQRTLTQIEKELSNEQDTL